ncbi:hypothetical protein XENOCAPTIV_009312 [Xenoophorus captivus]|uniref:Uncharacterized protein n=1 Tax=Xenoophorus captivus TaxID=1517983 RepID=A0ABV0QDV6_9TELE
MHPAQVLHVYLRMLALLAIKKELVSKATNNIGGFPISIVEKGSPSKTKHVSHKYNKLLNIALQNTGYIKQNWQLELNDINQDDMWEGSCISCHKYLSRV